MVVDGLTFDQMADLMKEHEVKCPDCGSEEFTEIRQFNNVQNFPRCYRV